PRLLDQPGGLPGVGDACLDRPSADLLRHSLGLVGPAPVADDDLGAGPCELRGDRAADPARGAGDERDLALERAERPRTGAGKAGTSAPLPLWRRPSRRRRFMPGSVEPTPVRLRRVYAACHAVAIDSSIFSSEARSLTEIAFTLRSIRLTRPDRTF